MLIKWSNINYSKIFKFGSRCHGLRYQGYRPDTVYITYTELKKFMTENHHNLKAAEDYLHKAIYPVLAIKDSKVVLVYL